MSPQKQLQSKHSSFKVISKLKVLISASLSINQCLQLTYEMAHALKQLHAVQLDAQLTGIVHSRIKASASTKSFLSSLGLPADWNV